MKDYQSCRITDILEGDISKKNPNAFGFFEVEITAPDLFIPILSN